MEANEISISDCACSSFIEYRSTDLCGILKLSFKNLKNVQKYTKTVLKKQKKHHYHYLFFGT